MNGKNIILILMILVIGLSACNGNVVPPSSSPAPPAESSSQEEPIADSSDSQPDIGNPEDNIAPHPEEDKTEYKNDSNDSNDSNDWNSLSEWRREILDEDEIDLIATTTTTDTVVLDDLTIRQSDSDAVPNSEGYPASFVGFITRYNNCSVRVQVVLTKDGGLFFPINMAEKYTVLGETVFEKSGINGAYGLTIPYINEPDAEHPGETKTGCLYAVTFEWDGGSAVYYSVGHDYYILQSSSNVKGYYMPDPKDIREENNSPEKESTPATANDEYVELPQNVVLPNAKTMPVLLDKAEQDSFVDSIDIEEIKRRAKEKNFGMNGDSLDDIKIENVKRLDGIGYLVALEDGKRATNHVVALYNQNNRLVGVTTGYETFTSVQQGIWPMGDGSGWLVGSDYSLFFIAVYESSPYLIRQVQWLTLEIKDPADSASSMYFGATFLPYPYAQGRPQADSDIFFAVMRRGDDLTALLYSKAILSKTAYIFQDLMRDVIAAPEQDYPAAQPYKASFDRQGNRVRVAFPTSCTVLDFDFNNYSVAYHTEYTKELLEQEYSQMLDSTYDGRFQLWGVNVRHGFESSWGSHVVYDTLTGHIQDFGAVGRYVRPTFADDRTAAVYLYEESDINLSRDDPDYEVRLKASIRQRIVLYDLITGERREPNLNLSEFGWSELIHGYAWDADTRQHIVLSTRMYKNTSIPIDGEDDPDYWGNGYRISYFSSDGALKKTYRIGVNRFAGMFEYHLPGFRPLGGGRVTLYRTGFQRDDIGVESYAFNPDTYELEDYFNADREKRIISYTISQWTQNGMPEYPHGAVSDYVDYWVEQPEGAEVFAHFIEQIQKTHCWVKDYYSPETGILIADDIYDLKFYWLSEDGLSIVTDMVTDKQSIWWQLYKPLYVQDTEGNWYGVYLAGERFSVYLWDEKDKLLYYIPLYWFSPLLPRGVNIYTGETSDSDIGLYLNEDLFPHSGIRWENGGITIYNEEKDLLRIYINSDSIRCVTVK